MKKSSPQRLPVMYPGVLSTEDRATHRATEAHPLSLQVAVDLAGKWCDLEHFFQGCL